MAKVIESGRITIPKHVRGELDLEPGDQVSVYVGKIDLDKLMRQSDIEQE